MPIRFFFVVSLTILALVPLAVTTSPVSSAERRAAPVSAAASRTYIFDGGAQRLVYKPRHWAAGGVGASARMENLRWTRSGPRSATAAGTAANNDCDPTCAEGSIIRKPGGMTWSRPRTCKTRSGRRYRYFSRVRYRINGERTTTFNFAANARYSCHR